ncbi:hypothetical protein PTKIN_Ptkin14bG0087600 [Pterospermum kingtungense]
MDNFGKSNFYGNSAGENTGEDILQSAHSGSYNYQRTIEVLLQDLDQEEIDVTKFTGKHYIQPETSSREEPQGSVVSNAALERKRKVDRDYRERCKTRKLEMTQNLETLGEENKRLKIEQESLKKKNAFMGKMLQSKTEEINQHKIHLESLKLENEKQNALVQILSDRVVNPDLSHENQKLRKENAELREAVNLSGEPLKLVEENAKLRYENLFLKVQIDALCGKIVDESRKKFVGINDWDKKH